LRPRYYLDNGEDALLMTLNPIQNETIRRFGGTQRPDEESAH